MADVDEIPPEKLADLRGALQEMVRERVDLTVRRLRERARAQMAHAGLVLAAYRAGRFPLEAPPPPKVAAASPPAPAPEVLGAPTAQQLASLVSGVDSHEKALDATREVMRAVALGLDAKVAGLLLDGLKEARQSIKGKATEGGDEVDDLLPATAEARELVLVFEGIADDARRRGVLEHARSVLEADRAAGPQAITATASGGAA